MPSHIMILFLQDSNLTAKLCCTQQTCFYIGKIIRIQATSNQSPIPKKHDIDNLHSNMLSVASHQSTDAPALQLKAVAEILRLLCPQGQGDQLVAVNTRNWLQNVKNKNHCNHWTTIDFSLSQGGWHPIFTLVYQINSSQ